MLGAQIPRGNISPLGDLFLADPYSIEIKEGAVLGYEVLILAHELCNTLVLRRVRIGCNAQIGSRTVIMPGVTIGESAQVDLLSLVERGTQVPPHEHWGGIPARKLVS